MARLLETLPISREITLGHGIQAFDLTRLENMIHGFHLAPLTRANTPRLEHDFIHHEIISSHNLVAAETAGKLIGVGMRSSDPGCPYPASLALFDVSVNPHEPRLETCGSGVEHVHGAQFLTYHGPDNDYMGVNMCVLFAETDIYSFNLDSTSNLP
jgi:hypothetical protein